MAKMKPQYLLVAFLSLTMTLVLTGCSLQFQAHADLDRHRKLWASQGIENYSYTLANWSVLSDEEILCAVDVRNNALSPADASCGYTVEELFAVSERQLAESDSILTQHVADIEYDDRYGMPISICSREKDIPASFGCFKVNDFVVFD
ncbi:MAG: hypothetical protein IPK16_07855 [Anaerolineales bacterium]|nr:hypothetical protein [Anaerolineales bacterium]